MAITAQDVKKLREMTGCGMMDCKKALTEAEGDLDRAADILREKGLAGAEKKAGRIAAEGIVYAYKDGNVAVLIEVNCETDFVARTEQFRNLVDRIAKVVADENPNDVDALLKAECDGRTVEDFIKDSIATIGENIKVRRFERVEGFTDTYIHMGGKIGVLVKTDVEADPEAIHDIALQVAAAKPLYVSREECDPEKVEHERAVLLAQALEENRNSAKPKPEAIIEKMVNGRMNKFYQEVCLLEQAYVKDADINVEKMINGRFKVDCFIRYEMGEGLEKRNDNLADEIEKQIKG
ncbi:MAG: elongation factor Ts [Clostridia bacterium]|jgi:elongation factor Ts|nr:elongation factor Ts [Clostridia bacterium]